MILFSLGAGGEAASTQRKEDSRGPDGSRSPPLGGFTGHAWPDGSRSPRWGIPLNAYLFSF